MTTYETEYTPEELERVADGAQRLDELVPDWASLVDLETFSILDPRCCVLAQVFPDFETGIQAIGEDMYNEGAREGKMSVFAGDRATEAWVHEIKARQGADDDPAD